VRLWRVVDGALLCTLKKDSIPISEVAFSPVDGGLAFGSPDGTVQIWQIMGERLYLLHILKTYSAVCGMAFSPDGHMLALGLGNGTIRLYQISGWPSQDQDAERASLAWRWGWFASW
jgi:WD40 repeat protein